MKRRTFLLKSNWIEVFNELSDKQAGILIKALYAYNAAGEMPTHLIDGTVKAYFNMMLLDCREMNDRYEAKCEVNRKNGKLGGAPKGNRNAQNNRKQPKQPKTTETTQNNRKQPKTTENNRNNPNDNENDNENENDKTPPIPFGDVPPPPSSAKTTRGRHPPSPRKKPDRKSPFGQLENVMLTAKEFAKLTERFGEEERDERIDRLSLYVGSSGKRYKSHYATILAWALKDRKKDNDGHKRPKTIQETNDELQLARKAHEAATGFNPYAILRGEKAQTGHGHEPASPPVCALPAKQAHTGNAESRGGGLVRDLQQPELE